MTLHINVMMLVFVLLIIQANGQCNILSVGYYVLGTSCTICPVGRYCVSGTNVSRACVPGTFQGSEGENTNPIPRVPEVPIFVP